jgi:hypothetical protein
MEYSQQARDLGLQFAQLQAQLMRYESTKGAKEKELALTVARRLAGLIHQLEKDLPHG